MDKEEQAEKNKDFDILVTLTHSRTIRDAPLIEEAARTFFPHKLKLNVLWEVIQAADVPNLVKNHPPSSDSLQEVNVFHRFKYDKLTWLSILRSKICDYGTDEFSVKIPYDIYRMTTVHLPNDGYIYDKNFQDNTTGSLTKGIESEEFVNNVMRIVQQTNLFPQKPSIGIKYKYSEGRMQMYFYDLLTKVIFCISFEYGTPEGDFELKTIEDWKDSVSWE
eukprot:c12848_g1_i1.p1 GENE.c12848_g1_i1~~c12848_g1_i1.p1  ORF type:complete len:232 (+),score=33.30 c12848_g1_i1:39-698(+)